MISQYLYLDPNTDIAALSSNYDIIKFDQNSVGKYVYLDGESDDIQIGGNMVFKIYENGIECGKIKANWEHYMHFVYGKLIIDGENSTIGVRMYNPNDLLTWSKLSAITAYYGDTQRSISLNDELSPIFNLPLYDNDVPLDKFEISVKKDPDTVTITQIVQPNFINILNPVKTFYLYKESAITYIGYNPMLSSKFYFNCPAPLSEISVSEGATIGLDGKGVYIKPYTCKDNIVYVYHLGKEVIGLRQLFNTDYRMDFTPFNIGLGVQVVFRLGNDTLPTGTISYTTTYADNAELSNTANILDGGKVTLNIFTETTPNHGDIKKINFTYAEKNYTIYSQPDNYNLTIVGG